MTSSSDLLDMQNAILRAAKTATYQLVTYDEEGYACIQPTQVFAPDSAFVRRSLTDYISYSSNSCEDQQDYQKVMFVLYVAFKQEVNFEEFEDAVMTKPLCKGLLRMVSSSIETPTSQSPHSGSVAEFLFSYTAPEAFRNG